MAMSLEVSGSARTTAEPAVKSARVLSVVPSRGGDVAALARVLGSLAEQPAERADVVVVLPAGARGAAAVAEGHGAAVVPDPGRGLSAAVNAGLRHARPQHEYVHWIGEADVLLPGALAMAVGLLEARPGAVLAFGDCRQVTGNGEYVVTRHIGASPARLVWGAGGPAHPAVVMRREPVAAAGGLDERLRHAMDLDLMLRLRRSGTFAATGCTLAVVQERYGSAGGSAPAELLAESLAETARVRSDVMPARLRPLARRWPRLTAGRTRDARLRAERSAAWR